MSLYIKLALAAVVLWYLFGRKAKVQPVLSGTDFVAHGNMITLPALDLSK